MKGMDIFCASQTATAIRHPMDEPSSSSAPSAAVLLGGGSSSPAIDRCNPIIADSRRSHQVPQPPIPKPPPRKKNIKNQNKKSISDHILQEKEISTSTKVVVRKSWRCTKAAGDFISPPGSTRYLLSTQQNEVFSINPFSHFADNNEPPPVTNNEPVHVNKNEPVDVKKNEPVDAKPPSSTLSPNQVVVLRVSLHCRGCEKKMRKHISRMEGVRSFNIDFAAKKVTVTGNVTALGVLSSISKVKNAQLWSPSLASSSPMNYVQDKGSFAYGISSN